MTDYFTFFELEPRLSLDLTELEKKFHELSRRHHPDYHTTSPPEDRERALEMTALLNDAYRTLKEPSRRAEYLVRSRGLSVDGSKVPAALLTDVFEINEQIDELKSAREAGDDTDSLVMRLEEFQERIRAMRQNYDERLREAFLEWDRLLGDAASETKQKEQLSTIANIVSHSSYIRNLERDIEREVSH